MRGTPSAPIYASQTASLTTSTAPRSVPAVCLQGGKPQVEDVPPLAWVDVEIDVRHKSVRRLDGRWLTVTAFDVADLMPNGMPFLGRSPLSEAGAKPSGQSTQRVTIAVPDGVEVKISAALDIVAQLAVPRDLPPPVAALAGPSQP